MTKEDNFFLQRSSLNFWVSIAILCFTLQPVQQAEAGLPQLENFKRFAKNKYPVFAAALDKCDYWDSLEKVMKKHFVTILIPRNPAIPPEFQGRSATFAKQIYGLHVIIGNNPGSSFTNSKKGAGFWTANLYPPAPKPVVMMWRLKTDDVLFNGTKDASGGAKFLRADIYLDASRVRAHLLDRTMLPSRFFVTREN